MTAPPPSQFRCRPARHGDAEPLKALLAEVGFQADAAIVTWTIRHPEMEIIVAADSHDKAIGFVVLCHRPNIRYAGRVAHIDDLVVSKAWRRHGVGRELLKRAVDRAKVLGVKRLEIQTLEIEGEDAGPFLTQCGLQPAALRIYKL